MSRPLSPIVVGLSLLALTVPTATAFPTPLQVLCAEADVCVTQNTVCDEADVCVGRLGICEEPIRQFIDLLPIPLCSTSVCIEDFQVKPYCTDLGV